MYLEFILLLITVFVSSFVSLCIPLQGIYEYGRPLLSTAVFAGLSYLTIHYGPQFDEVKHEGRIYALSDDTPTQIRNATRMFLSSLLIGGNAYMKAPFYTTGLFASMIGFEQISRGLSRN